MTHRIEIYTSEKAIALAQKHDFFLKPHSDLVVFELRELSPMKSYRSVLT